MVSRFPSNRCPCFIGSIPAASEEPLTDTTSHLKVTNLLQNLTESAGNHVAVIIESLLDCFWMVRDGHFLQFFFGDLLPVFFSEMLKHGQTL